MQKPPTASKEASMALSDHGQYSGVVDIARNGIDEVIRLQAQAKQDTELIRQMHDSLCECAEDSQEQLDRMGAAPTSI